MRLSLLFSLPALLSVSVALPLQQKDAGFHTRPARIHKDMSGKAGDPVGKYFHESTFHPHYDGRYGDHELGYRDRREALTNLIQTYLATMADIGVETWLVHGTLLGWWWNRKILPWDSDSDVQVSESAMSYLASFYNMTTYHYQTPRIPDGRVYMLEINPYYVNGSQSDNLNVIDARWVDMTSGLFIDITAVRHNAERDVYECKDGHDFYNYELFPLRDTFFEGVAAKIPNGYKDLLEEEYTQKALTLTTFEGHHFDEVTQEWLPIDRTLDWPTNDLFVSPDLKDFSEDADNKESEPKEVQQTDSTTELNANANDNLKTPHTPPKSAPQPPRAQKIMEEKVISGQEHRAELIKKTEERRAVEMTIVELEEAAGRGR